MANLIETLERPSSAVAISLLQVKRTGDRVNCW